MKNRNNEITAVLLATLSFFLLLSLLAFEEHYNPSDIYYTLIGETSSTDFPITGPLGASISAILMKGFLGYGSLSICSILFMYAYIIFIGRDYKEKRYKSLALYQLGLGAWFSIFLAWKLGIQDNSSGIIGYILHEFLTGVVSNFIYILLPVMLVILIRGIINVSLQESFQSIFSFCKQQLLALIQKVKKHNDVIISKNEEKINEDSNQEIFEEKQNIENQIVDEDPKDLESSVQNDNDTDREIVIEEEHAINEGNIDAINQKKYDDYQLPAAGLLNDPVEISNILSEEELKNKATQLVHALDTFGVQGKVTRISPGPVITLFEIEPAEGVRVNKFTTLSDDLARVMQAQRIRVIAPIPGSRSVGIELPNSNPQIVYLKSILNSENYINEFSKLTIAIGKTTTGDAFTIDLGKLPHLLVAGATGAGKSVCINTIIISILYKAKPDEVKFILIDPKKLELSTYKKLVGYHLITAPNLDEYVMTTADNAVGILDSAIHEMERRFSLFADAGVRNIEEYHNKYNSNSEGLEKIPYVVALIDELADLMMTSSRAIEDPITRLAQKARAVGIHLVVATQRPSVDVITGLIKSNFPARISFQVSSRVDSRTIIDQMGAEKLLGKGDMLFLSPGSAAPIRLHNAFVTLEEIEKVLLHISEQPKPNEIKLPEERIREENSKFAHKKFLKAKLVQENMPND